jgi:cephalosporin hydroxylase
MRTSWNQKYSYTFTWLGRPIIQHPEDVLRIQEVIYALKPDVIIETGVAHGGSLVLYASLLRAMGHGRTVIGVDIDIRPANKAAIQSHELAPFIQLVEGSSIEADTLAHVKQFVRPTDQVMVVLDSNHSKSHVLAELSSYAPMVSVGSYIVATDGIMGSVWNAPRGKIEWRTDNPCAAIEEFVSSHPEFVLETPAWQFNESDVKVPITAWPNAWLRRVR